MGEDRRARMMRQIERLREVMDEDLIFVQHDDGSIRLSVKAARMLARMAEDDAEQWRADHRGEAETAAADILARFQNKNAA